MQMPVQMRVGIVRLEAAAHRRTKGNDVRIISMIEKSHQVKNRLEEVDQRSAEKDILDLTVWIEAGIGIIFTQLSEK